MPKRYYWLKLQKDFFKRHDIRIVESMPNGKDYILFYLKLLVESIDHEGELRFSETIPYNEDMLSTITDTNVDVVRSAMKLFTELGMIELMEDSTIFMKEVEKMIGSEGTSAKKMRDHRQKLQISSHCDSNVTKCDSNVQKCDIEKEIEKEKELDIELDIDYSIKESMNNKETFQANDGSIWPNEKLQKIRNQILERTSNANNE